MHGVQHGVCVGVLASRSVVIQTPKAVWITMVIVIMIITIIIIMNMIIIMVIIIFSLINHYYHYHHHDHGGINYLSTYLPTSSIPRVDW